MGVGWEVVGYCRGCEAVKERLSSGSEGLCMKVQIYIQICEGEKKKEKTTVFAAAGWKAVVKRKSLRNFSIAVGPTAQCLDWLHEITEPDGVFKQRRP